MLILTLLGKLKILATAGFSVLILRTSLSMAKWRALVLLVLGCILVASPSFSTSTDSTASTPFLQLFGFGAVLLEVVLSGFASIYFEKVVKNTTEVVSIWERNFQLGLYSIAMYGTIIIYETFISASVSSGVTLHRWSFITFTVSVLGATGGLLVAATLKYTDSILKTMSTAGAIIISTLLGHYLLNGPMSLVIVIGGLVAIIAIANYMFDASSPAPSIGGISKQASSKSDESISANSNIYFSDKKSDNELNVDADVESNK